MHTCNLAIHAKSLYKGICTLCLHVQIGSKGMVVEPEIIYLRTCSMHVKILLNTRLWLYTLPFGTALCGSKHHLASCKPMHATMYYQLQVLYTLFSHILGDWDRYAYWDK